MNIRSTHDVYRWTMEPGAILTGIVAAGSDAGGMCDGPRMGHDRRAMNRDVERLSVRV